MISKANIDLASNGNFEFHMNTMGWFIQINHYYSWKGAIETKFGKGTFTVPKIKEATQNYRGMTNKGTIQLSSTAPYGLTIFWK